MLIQHILYADLRSSWDIIVKAPIDIFLDPSQKSWHTIKLWPTQKILTYVKKIFDPRKKTFNPHNPSKNYDPRKILTHAKNILTHATHAPT